MKSTDHRHATAPQGSLSPSSTRQLIGIDLLRFAAALLVVAHHLAFASWSSGKIDLNYHYLGRYTWFGAMGVEIFFVLSGFIIAYSAQNAHPVDFIRSRATRLYPAAILCGSVTFVVLLFSHAPEPHAVLVREWLRSILLWVRGGYIDPSYWTLPIEVGFYFLILTLLIFRRFENLNLLMVGIGLISTAAWGFAYAVRFHLLPATERGLRFINYIHLSESSAKIMLNHGCFFALGGLLWLCLFRRCTFANLLWIGLFLIVGVAEVFDHSEQIQIHYHSKYSSAPAVLLWLLATVALVLSVLGKDRIAQWTGKRGATVARQLGLMTYPLYLVHQTVGYIMIEHLHRHVPDILALLITTATALVSCFLLARYVEVPLQRWLRHVLPGRNPRVLVPATTLP